MAEGKPILGNKFYVTFLWPLIPIPTQITFNSVSGLGRGVAVETIEEGGQNLYSAKSPGKIEYENLVLERAIVQNDVMNIFYNTMLSTSAFLPTDIIVSAMIDDKTPHTSWFFRGAFPVSWSFGDLSADVEETVVEEIEFAYKHFVRLDL